ncbi:Sterol-sensing domain and Patched family-containing protein [Strongyloides ratti]|uniref:Sterol-sensing domain and Patched family-containing protein n=1 Tax=Strongyloides ratti TaxID=34506 RepID=A0A090LNL5_STRRB|nr:Sterol-sensing domain and Patched family-containing protein [Strongyloides ratti]CEF69120.1 Sterol-sensing domain and Patched family-containing protein [Strongyloides ratti]
MVKFDCLEKPLANWFRDYGKFVSKYPRPFIILPIFFTLFCAVGFLHMEIASEAVHLYTPTNAISKNEREIFHRLFPLKNDNYIPSRAVTTTREIQITLTTVNGENILDGEFPTLVAMYQKKIENEISIEYEGKIYGYHDLCIKFRDQGCPGTPHVQLISYLFQHGFNISFPTLQIGDNTGYIGSTLGGVKLFKGQDGKDYLYSAKSWLLLYHLKFYPENTSFLSGLWELKFQEEMLKFKPTNKLKLSVFHSQTLTDEIKRNGKSLMPKFAFALGLLVVFAVFSSLSFSKYGWSVDWTLSKPIPVLMGVLSAAMGIITSVGMLSGLGLFYNDIVGVMPFLVLAVGVDNTFLILSGVRRTSRMASSSNRISETLSEAGVSMFITSSTNALSFFIGAITTMPAVYIFCVYTAVALIFTFIYGITIYIAVLSLFLDLERNGKHCLFFGPIREIKEKSDLDDATLVQKLFFMGSPNIANITPRSEFSCQSCFTVFFHKYFGPILTNTYVRIFALILYIGYIYISIYGCLDIKEGLEPVNLLVKDSYAVPHYKTYENNFLKYGQIVQIAIVNPPDLRIKRNRDEIRKIAREFANSRYGAGNVSIQLWMDEVEYFLNSEIDKKEYNDDLYYIYTMNHFLSHPTSRFSEDIRWVADSKDGMTIDSFRFLVGMKDISTTTEQTKATASMRKIASKYSQYNVTTFMPLWLFTDQFALVIPNTVQNIVIALICMILIAVSLIPEPVCSIFVAFSIASVDVGVIGFMTLWGVNLDVISMITIIMSIGFSVDYSAHLTYGYVRSRKVGSSQKMIETVTALGLPLLQGAVSTILAVVTLADTPAYMVQTFFKTVFLAIIFGLLHGLVFLPIALSIFVKPWCLTKNSVQDTTIPIQEKSVKQETFTIYPVRNDNESAI